MKTSSKRILYIISFAEFWDMVSFFGTVSVLVLYTTKTFLFSDQDSYIIYGIYLALLCGYPIIGGLINDKLIGNRESLKTGALLMIFGNLLLFIKQKTFLFLGLSLTISGTALYKTTCTNLVGCLYDREPNKKDWAYTIFYAVLNCGAIVGPILYGFVAESWGWNYSFIIGALGILSSLYLFKLSGNEIYNTSISKRITSKNRIISYFILTMMVGCSTLSLIYYTYFNRVLSAFIVCLSVAFLFFIRKQDARSRKKLLGIILLLCFCILFFAASLQVGSSITLFINRFVDTSIFSINIPSSVFISLDPFFVVLTAPFFVVLWKKISISRGRPSSFLVMGVGLLFAAASFLFFWLSTLEAMRGGHFATLLLILLGYLMIGSGEMLFSPIVLSAISTNSPPNIKNTMMGSWYFFMAIAGYFGAYIDKNLTSVSSNVSQGLQSFADIFIFIMGMTFIFSLISLAAAKFFKNIID